MTDRQADGDGNLLLLCVSILDHRPFRGIYKDSVRVDVHSGTVTARGQIHFDLFQTTSMILIKQNLKFYYLFAYYYQIF